MNQITESQRLNTIREKLKDKAANGMLGVIAAKTTVPEWVLRDWCDNPMNTPSRDEIVNIQTVLGDS